MSIIMYSYNLKGQQDQKWPLNHSKMHHFFLHSPLPERKALELMLYGSGSRLEKHYNSIAVE
jgi:hypothetical protein